jgi:hypothetical protein
VVIDAKEGEVIHKDSVIEGEEDSVIGGEFPIEPW